MASVLAAADQFLDTAIRANDDERDYGDLCHPSQRITRLGVFDSEAVQLVAELSCIEEEARGVRNAAEKVSASGRHAAGKFRPGSTGGFG